MVNEQEKRQFKRVIMESLIEVSAVDQSGIAYLDKVFLKDISGGGIKFSTIFAGKYFIDQLINILIELPGNSNVKAQMKATATVVRIITTEKTVQKKTAKVSNIAARFNTPLSFERLL